MFNWVSSALFRTEPAQDLSMSGLTQTVSPPTLEYYANNSVAPPIPTAPPIFYNPNEPIFNPDWPMPVPTTTPAPMHATSPPYAPMATPAPPVTPASTATPAFMDPTGSLAWNQHTPSAAPTPNIMPAPTIIAAPPATPVPTATPAPIDMTSALTWGWYYGPMVAPTPTNTVTQITTPAPAITPVPTTMAMPNPALVSNAMLTPTDMNELAFDELTPMDVPAPMNATSASALGCLTSAPLDVNSWLFDDWAPFSYTGMGNCIGTPALSDSNARQPYGTPSYNPVPLVPCSPRPSTSGPMRTPRHKAPTKPYDRPSSRALFNPMEDWSSVCSPTPSLSDIIQVTTPSTIVRSLQPTPVSGLMPSHVFPSPRLGFNSGTNRLPVPAATPIPIGTPVPNHVPTPWPTYMPTPVATPMLAPMPAPMPPPIPPICESTLVPTTAATPMPAPRPALTSVRTPSAGPVPHVSMPPPMLSRTHAPWSTSMSPQGFNRMSTPLGAPTPVPTAMTPIPVPTHIAVHVSGPRNLPMSIPIPKRVPMPFPLSTPAADPPAHYPVPAHTSVVPPTPVAREPDFPRAPAVAPTLVPTPASQYPPTSSPAHSPRSTTQPGAHRPLFASTTPMATPAPVHAPDFITGPAAAAYTQSANLTTTNDTGYTESEVDQEIASAFGLDLGDTGFQSAGRLLDVPADFSDVSDDIQDVSQSSTKTVLPRRA
ncbi:hypothetical protein FRC07_000206 [Ceratobasidium sp. 392]|nr:hypothetical protein FRC07_000206 [Ceratobasidium sp. 392]